MNKVCTKTAETLDEVSAKLKDVIRFLSGAEMEKEVEEKRSCLLDVIRHNVDTSDQILCETKEIMRLIGMIDLQEPVRCNDSEKCAVAPTPKGW